MVKAKVFIYKNMIIFTGNGVILAKLVFVPLCSTSAVRMLCSGNHSGVAREQKNPNAEIFTLKPPFTASIGEVKGDAVAPCVHILPENNLIRPLINPS